MIHYQSPPCVSFFSPLGLGCVFSEFSMLVTGLIFQILRGKFKSQAHTAEHKHNILSVLPSIMQSVPFPQEMTQGRSIHTSHTRFSLPKTLILRSYKEIIVLHKYLFCKWFIFADYLYQVVRALSQKALPPPLRTYQFLQVLRKVYTYTDVTQILKPHCEIVTILTCNRFGATCRFTNNVCTNLPIQQTSINNMTCA